MYLNEAPMIGGGSLYYKHLYNEIKQNMQYNKHGQICSFRSNIPTKLLIKTQKKRLDFSSQTLRLRMRTHLPHFIQSAFSWSRKKHRTMFGGLHMSLSVCLCFVGSTILLSAWWPDNQSLNLGVELKFLDFSIVQVEPFEYAWNSHEMRFRAKIERFSGFFCLFFCTVWLFCTFI